MDSARSFDLPFVKMHGAGNDFVVIDQRSSQACLTPAIARAIGDRHRGVGFDQLVTIDSDGDADARLTFWNADGTTAGACGNATRCVAWALMDESGKDRLLLRTERGLLAAERLEGGQITVNMGQPQLDWTEVPLARPSDTLHLPLDGDPAAVGMGNPHCVFFVPDAEAVSLELDGPALEHNPLFPQRANVEFASLLGPDHLRLRVWERGAGVTLACGSGTCATAVAAARRGLTGRHVVVEADGGTLEVDWREDGVWLTGPVARVFAGSLDSSLLREV